MLAGLHLLIVLLVWLAAFVVIGLALYAIVRLAVTHALRAHAASTRREAGGPSFPEATPGA
ncbi:hypothetical protein [Microbacterium sp. JZ31]|uniref:hypothetical protein n=1 Tax=Microbacterium sp. JZ31 TaxID=1906274 RepID=UPI0019344E15|nr:hypothetical protein [Microbacterium sp. JZ31]